MLKRTSLYNEHLSLNARMVDFAGWEMPLHYGSQIEEHHYVRQHAGIFDVSHMNVTDVLGEKAFEFLQYLFANDIAKLVNPGKALYTCMLNEEAGVIDDLIVYFISPGQYRLILNAGTKEKDLAWINKQAKEFSVNIVSQDNLSIIALQGPKSLEIMDSVFGGLFFDQIAVLKPFQFLIHDHLMIARTGYTGEEGFEMILSSSEAVIFWKKFLEAGARPIGLGARDSLRLEAGFNLYGLDMDESISPLEANLEWTLVLDEARDFIGKKAVLAQKEQGVGRFLVGLILEKGGVLRHGQKVMLDNAEIGEITSGGFSPTLNCSIAMARLSRSDIKECQVDLRGKPVSVKVVRPAFVRKGKSLVE